MRAQVTSADNVDDRRESLDVADAVDVVAFVVGC
jgi:hypothetical protein